jgi:hyperosmotically inducible protein
MPRTLFAVLLFSLAACSDPTPPVATAQAKPHPQAETKAPEAPKPDPNHELATRVKRALEDERKLQAGGIDVTAADGMVTLWGTAASADEHARAGRVAGKVDGVKSVENKLVVVRGS